MLETHEVGGEIPYGFLMSVVSFNGAFWAGSLSDILHIQRRYRTARVRVPPTTPKVWFTLCCRRSGEASLTPYTHAFDVLRECPCASHFLLFRGAFKGM